MEGTLNNTRVVFDYKLKQCIMNIPKGLLDALRSIDYMCLQDAQEDIREYFRKHQREFNIAGILKNSYENCPDYYALLSAVTADLSACESWTDVYEQFTSSFRYNDQLNNMYDASGSIIFCDFQEDYNELIKITCMCSHRCCPENMSIITNKYTGLNNLIACDCLEKTGIISSYQFKKKRLQNDAYAKIIVKKEEAKMKKKNIYELFENIVSKYTNKIITHRKCQQCNVLNILKDDPAWKKICKNCYIQKNEKIPRGVCLLKTK